MALDQGYIPCPVCGTKVQYDRWSDEPQELFCSEECKEKMQEIMGIHTKDYILKRRAANPNVCVSCGAILTNKTRSGSLYCSPKCQKRARRAGIYADSLVKIRMSAIAGMEGAGKGYCKKDLDGALQEGQDA
jgi:predicted nucleic acid-binding Zn ribbon protein